MKAGAAWPIIRVLLRLFGVHIYVPELDHMFGHCRPGNLTACDFSGAIRYDRYIGCTKTLFQAAAAAAHLFLARYPEFARRKK